MKLLKTLAIAFFVLSFNFPIFANDLILTFPEKIQPSGGFASNFQLHEGIEKSFDGDFTTIYHSHWTKTLFPVTLQYNFKNIDRIDYLIYHPRQDATNGLFKQVEIWYVTNKQKRIKLGDYDFGGKSVPMRIDFTKPLIKPASIELIVKSGLGDNETGFASCAEMEFFRQHPEKNFDLTAIFSNNLCTKLRSDITQQEIERIPNNTIKNLVHSLVDEKVPGDFRVAEFKPFQHPDIMAKTNKTGAYSLRDNPTGIAVAKGEELLVFVEDLHGQSISILVQNLDKGFGGTSYPLKNGVNLFTMADEGLAYVVYLTETATEPPVKMFFASGTINGYFDSQKHVTKDWKMLLDKNASYKYFDVLGKYSHLTFPSEDFRKYTPDGLALINTYDRIVRLQHEFMGLYKYNRLFRNRIYLHVDYSSMWMYATSYHTGYNIQTMSRICDVNKLLTSEIWGPAHEIGHVNQTRPGMKWQGMTEVTNNIYSLYLQTEFGNPSRIMNEPIKDYGNRYNMALKTIVEKGIAHNIASDVFCKLVPFWQLKLYVHDVLGNHDFYKDIYEQVRVNPDPASEGECQLNFVKYACEIANLDLTDFFRSWGFLTPIDLMVNDYGKIRFIITQEQIDAVLKEIGSMNLPKPMHDNIYLINDDNINLYKK